MVDLFYQACLKEAVKDGVSSKININLFFKIKYFEVEKMKHPTGLFVLSSTEMCERFSYYIILSILVLYMGKFYIFHQHSVVYCQVLLQD